MAVQRFMHGGAEVFPGPGHGAAHYNDVRIQQVHPVAQGYAQHPAVFLPGRPGRLITLARQTADLFGRIGRTLTVAVDAHQSPDGDVVLPAMVFVPPDSQAVLGGGARGPVIDPAVQDNPPAEAGAQGHAQHVRVSLAGPPAGLTQGENVGVVVQPCWHTRGAAHAVS